MVAKITMESGMLAFAVIKALATNITGVIKAVRNNTFTKI